MITKIGNWRVFNGTMILYMLCTVKPSTDIVVQQKWATHYGGSSSNTVKWTSFWHSLSIVQNHVTFRCFVFIRSFSLLYFPTLSCWGFCWNKYKLIHQIIIIFPYFDWNVSPCFLKMLSCPLISYSDLGWLLSRTAASYILGFLFLSPLDYSILSWILCSFFFISSFCLP